MRFMRTSRDDKNEEKYFGEERRRADAAALER
jgi:hypothetical protein